MTDTDVAPTTTGTWEYARAALHMLTDHEAAWSTDDLTTLSVGPYDVRLQFGTEEAAEFAAIALDITAAPVGTDYSDPRYAGYERSGFVDGVRVNVVSCWRVEDPTECAA